MNELQGGQIGGRKLSFEESSEVQEGNNESLNLGNVRGDRRVSRVDKLGKQQPCGMATGQGTLPSYVCLPHQTPALTQPERGRMCQAWCWVISRSHLILSVAVYHVVLSAFYRSEIQGFWNCLTQTINIYSIYCLMP